MFNHTPEPQQHSIESTVNPALKDSPEAKALAESLTKALNKPKDAPGAIDAKKEKEPYPAPARIAFGGCSH
jgi:hypothetical protein